MPIKRIGVNRYIWQKPPSLASMHEGPLGKGAINPLQRWRKVPASGPGDPTSTIPEGLKNNVGGCACVLNANKKHLVQEVFKDSIPPGSSSHCRDSNGKCLLSYKGQRIRSGMLHTNAQLNRPAGTRASSRNYNYKQYLQSKCKTIKQNSFNFSTNNTGLPANAYRGQCTTSKDCSCAVVTYKPNNKKYSQQGAVSSGTRLARLKYNAITKAGKSVNSSTPPVPYRGGEPIQNQIIKSKSCTDKLKGAGKLIYRSGGPRRPPRNKYPPYPHNKRPPVCETKCCDNL